MNSEPKTETSANATPQALLVTYALTFTAAAAAANLTAQTVGLPLLLPLAMLLGWAALVAIASLLQSDRFRLRSLFILLGAVVVIGIPGRFYLPGFSVNAATPEDSLRFLAVGLSIVTFVLHFLATYGAHSQKELSHPSLETLVPLTRLLSTALAATVVVVLAFLYFQKLWIRQAELAFAVTLAILVAEAGLQAIARLYLPKRLRGDFAFGKSILLPALFGKSGPLQSLSSTLEKTFGVRLGDTWLARLGLGLAAPFVLLLIVGLWLSTGLTLVPVNSKGVLVQNGAFQDEALPPGLHTHAPWPFARIEVVNTDKIEELALGFERDLSRPVLWAEKHFAGEQNLLVGGGDELLTVNVPIHYRIKDAAAYLKKAGDAKQALTSLGYHELLLVTNAHDARGLMVSKRDEVAEQLRAGIQAAADQLELGIEITFVGLKDVHPPVDVASAYQDVISAEEQRHSLIDQARADAVSGKAAAQIDAQDIRIKADTSSFERLTRASSETTRFLAPLATWLEHPDSFATRLRLEALEDALSDIRKLYILPAGTHQHSTFLLDDKARSSASDAPVVRPSNPVVKQVVRSSR